MLLSNRTISLLFLVAMNGLLLLACGGGGGGGSSTDNSPTPAAPVITQPPASQIVMEGQNVTFTVTATGAEPMNYQWWQGGTKVGSDSERLNITSVKAENAGNYTVRVSNSIGDVTSNAAILTVTPVGLSDRTFTLGVWNQGPNKKLNGENIATLYKKLGINTFVGLWKFPTEDWAYEGYTENVVGILKEAGLKAYAGHDETAVAWINTHPEYRDTIIGYVLGDEPDMNRNSSDLVIADANTPTAWKARGDALIAADNTRPVYANFGKPIAKDVWSAKWYGSTGSKESDYGLYMAPTTICSSDFYGITDPYELPANHGIWTYGRTVRNTKKYALARPVWGFVEASAPWKFASDETDNWMFQHMPPSHIMPIVWNMVVNGAQGIVYFCHDFSPSTETDTNKGAFAALLEPGIPEAMRVANESVMAYGAILKTPTIPGTTVTTDGSVDVVVLTKKFNGNTYVFAMADGNATFREGKAVEAEIQASSTRTGSVEVLNDLRTVTMTNGKISDHFEPYELHIYKF